MPLLRYLYRLGLGVWTGALLFFGAVVTPTLFRVLTPAQSAAVVRPLIGILDRFSLVAGPLLVILAWVAEGRPDRRAKVRAGLLLGMAAWAGISAFVVSPRLAALRERAGEGISSLAAEDPLRKQFGALHGVSSTLMLGELLLGLAAVGFPLRPGKA